MPGESSGRRCGPAMAGSTPLGRSSPKSGANRGVGFNGNVKDGHMHRWMTWNVFFPLQEWIKGHPTLRILKEMEAVDTMTADELERLQARKLLALFEYGNAHVPYV